jgi:hypothetical protein
MTRSALAVVLFAITAVPGRAVAQERRALSRAETAYEQVDLEGTLEHARQALEEGGYDLDQLVRIYELMGIAAAALDEEDQARDAYLRMLALEPDAQVDRNLSPQMRSPFLEARGYWAAHSERLEATATFVRGRGALRIELEDPLGMAASIVVHGRVGDEEELTETTEDAAGTVVVAIPGAERADRVEAFVTVLDEHGNHIIELGSETEPLTEGGDERDDTGRPGGGRRRTLWIVVSAVGGALLVGGVTAAIIVGTQDQDAGIATDITIGVR